MYKFSDIKRLDLEITSNCQASCPMCARNYHGGSENPILEVTDISYEKFKRICTESFVQQLEHISMCGNYGDPIVNRDLMDIVEYITITNPKIRVDIHTNGSAKSLAWWEKLAKVLPNSHCVQFGIDGLVDTHSLYRVGTNFNNIIENAKAFIEAGGKARWNFITFKHNEHQLEIARQMAKDIGFESFQEKQTSRFIGNPWFDVYDRDGKVTHRLEQPTEQKLVFIDKKTVVRYQELISASTVKCQVEESNSVYIDAKGYLWPCCFVGATPYIYTKPSQMVHNYQQASKASLDNVLSLFGGIEKLDIDKSSVKEIVDSDMWQTVWDDNFNGSNKLHVCARVCGKFPEQVVSQCRDQFLDLDNFNE